MMSDTRVYDIICVGFGTTSIAVAAVLAEQSPESRVLFIDSGTHFEWKPVRLFPDEAVGSSFLHDVITTQNPRSQFTFVNFLHTTNLFGNFTNASRLAPSRRLMGTYLRWISDQIEAMGWIKFGSEVVSIHPRVNDVIDRIDGWSVGVQELDSGKQFNVQARQIIIASERVPEIPNLLASPSLKPVVVHSSLCLETSKHVLRERQNANIAIVGEDQEAAEIFEYLHKVRGSHSVTMYMTNSTLEADDNTRESRNAVEAPKEQFMASLPPELRLREVNAKSPSTSKVSPATIERIDELQYAQSVSPLEASRNRFILSPSREVLNARKEPGSNKISLTIRNRITGEIAPAEQAYDLVISASGYKQAPITDIIHSCQSFLEGGSTSVDRNYRVNFRRGALSPGCGLWLMNSLGTGQARTDDISLLAERAHRVARSMMAVSDEKKEPRDHGSEMAML